MSLQNYVKARDRFELDDVYTICLICKRSRVKHENAEPCRSCDHNANAVPDTKLKRRCGDCGTEDCNGYISDYDKCDGKNWTPRKDA